MQEKTIGKEGAKKDNREGGYQRPKFSFDRLNLGIRSRECTISSLHELIIGVLNKKQEHCHVSGKEVYGESFRMVKIDHTSQLLVVKDRRALAAHPSVQLLNIPFARQSACTSEMTG